MQIHGGEKIIKRVHMQQTAKTLSALKQIWSLGERRMKGKL